MTDLSDVTTHPTEKVVALVDAAMPSVAARDLVPASEVADLLLDIRSAASALHFERRED